MLPEIVEKFHHPLDPKLRILGPEEVAR